MSQPPPKRRLANLVGDDMSRVIYRVVRHDGHWAYEGDGTVSECFRTREQARAAARLAARGQCVNGASTPIDSAEKAKSHNEIGDTQVDSLP